MLAQIATQIDMMELPEQSNISACVQLLAGLKFNKSFLQQFLNPALMQESPIYQEILQQGRQQGLQQGLQQGEQRTVMRQLQRRFGSISPQAQAQIQQLSTEQLDALSEILLDFTDANELTVWLQSQRNSSL